MNIRQGLAHGRILPAVKHISDISRLLPLSRASIVIVLGGSINELPEIQRVRAKHPEKLVFMHVDLLEGIGRDAEGIRFLKKFGLHGIVSVKSRLLNYAKDNGLLTIQRLFLLDSESLATGLRQMEKNSPDAIEILPAVVPENVISEFKRATDRPLLGGGLMRTEKDIELALANGFDGVSVSRQSLWNMT